MKVPHDKRIEEEMSHFVDCIERGTRPEIDPVSSLEGLRVIWKLYEAEQHGAIADLRDISVKEFLNPLG